MHKPETLDSMSDAGIIRGASPAVRIAVVDDCALFRRGVAQALAGEETIEIVGEAESVGEAIRMTYEKRPDIVLFSGTSSEPEIAAISTFRAVLPDAKIVIIGAETGESRVKAALIAGARAYVSKHVTRAELIDTIHAIRHDEAIVTLGSPTGSETVARLTPREQQILDHVAQGQPNKEIARALRISEKTVKQHITRILEKLGAHNRVEAMLMAPHSRPHKPQ